MNQTHTLISIATAWGPKFGGINAFNYDLLIAVAAANWQWLRVICVVSSCTADEVHSAKVRNQVELIDLGLDGGSIGKEHAALAWQKLLDASVGNAKENLVWVGHDRITGAVCIDLAKTHGGRSALIHHMSYAHYESFAEDSATAHTKEREQKQLFNEANICLAIGPLLRSSAAQMLDRLANDIPMLIPGLAEITPRKNHHQFIAFVSGRFDASAIKLKQAHLGVAGFAHAVRRCDSDSGLPDALRGEYEPKLILRGIELERLSDDSPGAETELKALAQQYANRVIVLKALPFTKDRKELFDELKDASVCLMPSWHEGFGLVAWEAIAAGVPIVLSKKSGAYQFLKERKKENLVYAIDVKGKEEPPFFSDQDKENLADLLIQIAKNHSQARVDAHRLREELQTDYRWPDCAKTLMAALSWQAPTTLMVEPSVQPTQIVTALSKTPGLDQWMELPMPLWHLHPGLSPSQLLKAEEALIPFASERALLLQTQIEWATNQTHPICVRLLTGEGGAGKTRLALEMCEHLTEQGWAVGFLRSGVTPQVATFVKMLSESTQPVLLVLDYAESRSDELLRILAALLSQKVHSAVRVFLLARSSGEWWDQLPSRNARCEALLDGFATTGPYTLPPLYTKLCERNNAFTQALRAFAHVLNVGAPRIRPDLSTEQYHSPLYLQMAALLTLLGEHTGNADLLPQSLVRHEQRYWHKVTVESSNADATRLMSLVTLVGSAPTTKAIEPLWVAAGGRTSSLKSLFANLSPLYPGHQGLGALQPDLLGEALVSRQVLGSYGEALLDAALGEKANSAQRSHALTVIARLLRYRSDLSSPLQIALTKHFPRCARELFHVCIQTSSPLQLVIERSYKQLTPHVALQVAGILVGYFKHEVLPLIGLEIEIRKILHDQAQLRYQKSNHSIDDAYGLGLALDNLSIAYSRLGDVAKALIYAKEALVHYERLTRRKPGRFEPDLANSLSNYAIQLADAGDSKQALTHAEQSLGIYMRLARAKPKDFEHALAGALNNYANRLAESGENILALECMEQALGKSQRLAKTHPERFDPDLATSLNNYAIRLAEVGKTNEALASGEKSLNIRRRLAEINPEHFQPDLASSLNNYSIILAKCRDPGKALECAKDALDIYSQLAKGKPERF